MGLFHDSGTDQSFDRNFQFGIEQYSSAVPVHDHDSSQNFCQDYRGGNDHQQLAEQGLVRRSYGEDD